MHNYKTAEELSGFRAAMLAAAQSEQLNDAEFWDLCSDMSLEILGNAAKRKRELRLQGINPHELAESLAQMMRGEGKLIACGEHGFGSMKGGVCEECTADGGL